VIADPLDPITLEVWWSRLVAIADEAATTLLRTAFSTIIRESNDYTVVLMNTSGQTIAECHAGIPAFAALMSVLTRHLLEKYPAETWRDGDAATYQSVFGGTIRDGTPEFISWRLSASARARRQPRPPAGPGITGPPAAAGCAFCRTRCDRRQPAGRLAGPGRDHQRPGPRRQ
jgi:hypothetical protein